MVDGVYKPFRVLPGPWESHLAAGVLPPRLLPLTTLGDLPSLLAAADLTGQGTSTLDLISVHVHGARVAQVAQAALLLRYGLVGTDEMTVLSPRQRTTFSPMVFKRCKPFAREGVNLDPLAVTKSTESI
jgi:hypothetical protein